MLVEQIQHYPVPSLARFCANIANDPYVNPGMTKQASALSEEWVAIESKRAWQYSVEEYKLIETRQQVLRARMIDFLVRLSAAVTKRNEPLER